MIELLSLVITLVLMLGFVIAVPFAIVYGVEWVVSYFEDGKKF